MRRAGHKYNAKRTEVDGVVFHSKKEARRYQELKLLEKAGEIHELELQPEFPLLVCDTKVGVYRGDFKYAVLDPDGCFRNIVEDVKGVRTPVYRLKRKMVEAQYGIQIREV